MKKILVVDDSEMVRQQVGASLSAAGYSVLEARDGMDALERLADHADVAMVILDINMPRMNGLEMLDRLHENERPISVPVLVLTTEADPALVARARKAGAKGWVVKPIKPDLLVTAVRKLTA